MQAGGIPRRATSIPAIAPMEDVRNGQMTAIVYTRYQRQHSCWRNDDPGGVSIQRVLPNHET